MKQILLIGVGGTGSSAVDALTQKLRDMGNTADTHITALVFDTDIGSISGITAANSISMADTAGVGAVCDRLGNDKVAKWFPFDVPSVRAQDLVYGASQWRKKSYLAFLNAMNKQASYTTFIRALEEVGKNANDTCEVYVIASIAGGTGSGSFIPIALFAKRYLCNVMQRDPIVNAMIALPDIYEESQTPDNRIKIYANAYAILRELNAINQVARGYNEEVYGSDDNKKSPIRFVIGDEKDRNVGVLFDASNPEYWTPKAAPFDQIFILDRMPGVHSIHAHDIILANSLYALIGTKMGSCFKSAQNNSLMMLAQNNGSNAIYAGISTAELRFPKETILSYLAHEKAYRACEEEWLVLHRLTEKAIRERERKARERKKRFFLEDGTYASIYLTQLKNLYHTPSGNVIDIVERGTTVDKSALNTAETYFNSLLTQLADQLNDESATSGEVQKESFAKLNFARCPGFFERIFKKGAHQSTVAGNIQTIGAMMRQYYRDVSEFIRDTTTSLIDAILPFQKGMELEANEKLSLVHNLLKTDKGFVHPVAAMTQLCRLKMLLKNKLDPLKDTAWKGITSGQYDVLPDGVFSNGSPDVEGTLKENKSTYADLDGIRLPQIMTDAEKYRTTKKTDPYTDNAYLVADALASINTFSDAAKEQLYLAVLSEVSRYVDGLIIKYREFFDNFEEARRDLGEALKTAKELADGRVDGVLNVYSTVAEKEQIFKEVEGQHNETLDELFASDDIAGKSVFDLCYEQLARDISEEFRYSDKELLGMDSLFANMVKNYEDSITQKNSVFGEINKLDVFSAIRRSCLKSGSDLHTTLENYLQCAMGIAQPALSVDTTHKTDGSVNPSDLMVAMISTETARSIKRNAEYYDIKVPANITIEQTVLETAAELFLKKFTANNHLQVAVVDNMPNDVMYITGQKTNITPLRIAKFDELSSRPVYFNYYKEAIANSKRYSTDMWNPHLGFDLHKRGYLPYMNPDMEERCDETLVKALLYALTNDCLVYKKDSVVTEGCYRLKRGGSLSLIVGSDGRMITRNNEAQLMNWLRNQEELIEEWSRLFDRDLDDQKRRLPVIVAESQRDQLERAITVSPFTKMLRSAFFNNLSSKARREEAATEEETSGVGILEFAFRIKASEESLRDCNDAERILRVAYKIFFEFCEYRVNRRVAPEWFAMVYKQQLESLFVALAKSETIRKQKTYKNGTALYGHIVSWVNEAKTFLTIPSQFVDEYGNLLIDEPFHYLESKKVQDALREALQPDEEPVET